MGKPMVGYTEIHNAPLPQLLRWWDGADPPLADFEEGFLDEVAYALTKHRPEGIAALKRYLGSNDPKWRSAALRYLAYPGVADEEVLADLEQTFRNGDRDLKFIALWGFIHLAYFPLPRHQVEALMNEEDERMAALAMVYLSRAMPAEAVKILGVGLSSPNPRKREFACDEVGDRGIGELSERLRLLLTDPDGAVAEAARSNLEFFSDG
ncbi:MAG: HEAT repeat domain-containing protein [Gemmataceae bacterium]